MRPFDFPNLTVEFLRRRIQCMTPAGALDLVMAYVEEGEITREEALDLLDRELPALRVNSPGGTC